MEENMDRFELINGILIDKEQVKLFIERLTKKYAGWEIEDILYSLINKDIDSFETFVTEEREEYIAFLEERVDDLEQKVEELKVYKNAEEIRSIEQDYLRIINEQRSALQALGMGHLILDRESLHRVRDGEEEPEPSEPEPEKPGAKHMSWG